jgi:hypothetical protein
MKKISQTEIEKWLELYKSEYRLVKNAYYANGLLTADIIPVNYIFTTDDLNYLTATQIHLYLSQLTYVLIANCLNDSEYKVVSKYLTFEDFISKMYAGQLFFVDINQKMKKVIYKNNEPITSELKIIYSRKVGKSIFFEMSFDIAKGSCIGTILTSMKPEKYETR